METVQKVKETVFNYCVQRSEDCTRSKDWLFYYYKKKYTGNQKEKAKQKATSKTWTQTLKNLDSEKPGPWKTWIQKNLDSEKPVPWKIWTLKILDYEKRGKQLDAAKKIKRPHGIIY